MTKVAASKERVKSPRQTVQTMIRLIKVFTVCYSDMHRPDGEAKIRFRDF